MESPAKAGANDLFRKIRNSLDASLPQEEREAIAFLLMEHFGISREQVFRDAEVELNEDLWRSMVIQINSGEPPQYALGWCWFMGMRIGVGPEVLIPRPETEQLVELALAMDLPANAEVWDLATGSGAIAVSLASIRPNWKLLATDISEAALVMAEKNSMQHHCEVEFIRHDLLSGMPPADSKPDLIISNPPYVGLDESEDLDERVSKREPRLALFAPSDDVVGFYRALASIGRGSLREGGQMLVEINQRYAKEVCECFKEKGFSKVNVIRDLSGNDRFVHTWWH